MEAAKSADEEIAEWLEAQGEFRGTRNVKPPLQEFPREVELLQLVYHRLGEVITAIARSGGSKKKVRNKPLPVPETGAELLRRRRAREAAEHVESMLRYPDGRPVS